MNTVNNPTISMASNPMNDKVEPRCEIGIDCGPPECTDQEAEFRKLLRGSGLRVSDFELTSKFYGAWIWVLKSSPEKREIFLRQREFFRNRLIAFIENRIIRGAQLKPPETE